MDKIKQITKAGASKITDKAQIHKLRLQGKTADEAFVFYKLDQAGDNLLNSPQFKNWFTYMTKVNKQHPKTAILSSLKTRYTDEALAKMFEAARKVPATDSMGTKLQVAQMREWLRAGKSVDNVFELLKLDDGLDKLLTNPSLAL
jgi:hypothetical protein